MALGNQAKPETGIKTMEYFVIGNATGESQFVLNLEPQTIEQCKRAIAWQRQGQGHRDAPGYWQITEYEPSNGFVGLDGRSYIPDRAPFTESAWSAFMERLDA